MDGADPTAFFVYGSLRTGQRFFRHFASDVLTSTPAQATGTLYDLPRRGYPIAVDTGEGRLIGEIMTFPDPHATLRGFDTLEEYDPTHPEQGPYVRYARDVRPLDGSAPRQCWIYLATPETFAPMRSEAVLVPSGDWVSHLKETVTR